MPNPRRRVPSHLADDIAFAADLRCCLCERRGGLPPRARNGQIHHLDGDASNNDPDNLAWLCLEHHGESEKVGTISRRVTPGLIKRYREQLVGALTARQRASDARQRASGFRYVDALDACIVLDLSKLQTHFEHDWARTRQVLPQIATYPEAMGFEARRQILGYLDGLAARTRAQMPRDIAQSVVSIALNVLPVRFPSSHRGRRLATADEELLQQGVSIGATMAYDGGLYLKDAQIVEEGVSILWRTLSLAVARSSQAVKRSALDGFSTAKDGASRSGHPVLVKLVDEAQVHGLAGETHYPDYSDAVVKALTGRR